MTPLVTIVIKYYIEKHFLTVVFAPQKKVCTEFTGLRMDFSCFFTEFTGLHIDFS